MTVGCGGEASGADLAERLIELRNSIDVLELAFSRTASAFAQTEEANEQGYDSPISWIKQNCHMGGGAAADRVCAGAQLDRLTESTLALAEGRIGFAHYALLAKTATAMGGRFKKAGLLRKAREHSVKPLHERLHARAPPGPP